MVRAPAQSRQQNGSVVATSSHKSPKMAEGIHMRSFGQLLPHVLAPQFVFQHVFASLALASNVFKLDSYCMRRLKCQYMFTDERRDSSQRRNPFISSWLKLMSKDEPYQ